MNFANVMTRAPVARLALLQAAMIEFGINDPLDQAAFLATVAHESAELSVFSENLNYSAPALRSVFGKYFPTDALANAYARQPQRIASRVYADRNGNGSEASGDGWRYRGAGAIQLTFKDNQVECAKYFGIAPAIISEWLRTPEGAVRSAAWFWIRNNLQRYSLAGDFDGVCDVVNRGHKTPADGDSNGWAARLAYYQLARGELCEP